jgi:hypothetical protein
MKKTNNLDDYRRKLVMKIVHADSYEQIKRYLFTATKALEEHQLNGHLINRFIDKSINQLHGLGLLELNPKAKLNALYAKRQLELIKRRITENKTDVQA